MNFGVSRCRGCVSFSQIRSQIGNKIVCINRIFRFYRSNYRILHCSKLHAGFQIQAMFQCWPFVSESNAPSVKAWPTMYGFGSCVTYIDLKSSIGFKCVPKFIFCQPTIYTSTRALLQNAKALLITHVRHQLALKETLFSKDSRLSSRILYTTRNKRYRC